LFRFIKKAAMPVALRSLRTGFAHLLPPAFVLGLIATINSIYARVHLLPMLQLGLPPPVADAVLRQRGWFQVVVSQWLLAMLLICFFRASLTSPGSVPKTATWLSDRGSNVTREMKLSGKRRHCKWCQQYKPDRTHHCRVCESCVLRMDHHCPWIMNCVGFKNHKYFFLLVSYAVLDCFFVTATLVPTVSDSVVQEMPISSRFALVLAITLSTLMGIVMLVFLAFHFWLATKAMTTIEFCEKTTGGWGDFHRFGANYHRGFYNNMKAVFGPRPALWWLPLDPPEGDGLTWFAKSNKGLGDPLRADPEWTGREAF
jgi:hypothetical protein